MLYKYTMERRHTILFVSHSGLCVDCAWQCAREGASVRMAIEDERDADIGDGFIEKTRDWRADVDWADVVIFDDTLGYGTTAAELRASGKRVIGGTAYTDRLEDDRAFGQGELVAHGVPTLPSWSFTDFGAACSFVEKNPGRYVFKPDGEASNAKQILYVGRKADGSDLVGVLQGYREVWGTKIHSFQLQTVATGIEVAVGAFFNGTDFVLPININLEHKKLFPYEVGPATGEMGTSMCWVPTCGLFESTLARFAPTLRREGYVGYLDLNCIADEHGVYPLEFTARFGYPTIQIQSAMFRIPLSDFFYRLAYGEASEIPVAQGCGIGVRAVVPPYPFNDHELFAASSRGAAVTRDRASLDGIHIEDVKIDAAGTWRVTGQYGVALILTGVGATAGEARARAYDTLASIHLPNMYYRHDIGERHERDLAQLRAWGYVPQG